MTADSPTRTQHPRDPIAWGAAALAGGGIGWAMTALLPPAAAHPEIPAWLLSPFALLLLSIAVMPFISSPFWHRFYPAFALFFGAIVVACYLTGFTARQPGATMGYGQEKTLHAAHEYFSFIALVGGLYVVSGGILVDLRGRAGPMVNGLMLAGGSILANIVGTTGASMLLIRPFMRVNRGRLRPLHIVFFLFIVSNAAGSLTPIGDPPLYLGYLKGVPFFWTAVHLFTDWLFTVGILLALFTIFDWKVGAASRDAGPPLTIELEAESLIQDEAHAPPGLRVRGWVGMVALTLMVAGVFIDPLLKYLTGYEGFPVGATFQIVLGAAAYYLAPGEILRKNEFTFGPANEVAFLFLGIFATMTPALAYLSAHGQALGLQSPTALYFGTGALSAFLDNAPTYLNFLQVAVGEEMTPESIRAFLSTHQGIVSLNAISTGAVFFGAMTYIGNGPNFMVKAVAESAAVPMPSFMGYLLRACLLLLPVLLLHWLIFIYPS